MQARDGTALQMDSLWNRWFRRQRLHAQAPRLPRTMLHLPVLGHFVLESSFINHSMQRRPVLARRPPQAREKFKGRLPWSLPFLGTLQSFRATDQCHGIVRHLEGCAVTVSHRSMREKLSRFKPSIPRNLASGGSPSSPVILMASDDFGRVIIPDLT
jgi:hypothetical protein